MDKGEAIDSAVSKLAGVRLNLSENPWRGVLWNPATKTMIVKHKKLAMNLLLYLAGQDPMPIQYDIVGEYRRVLGDEKARRRRH